MTASVRDRWLRAATLVATAYLAIGVAFPNPSAANERQFLWRLAAWSTSLVVFAIHIWYEHDRRGSSPLGTALHASVGVALGAFGLAAAANVHSLRAGVGNRHLLVLALVAWPILTGVPAFVVALAAAAALARVRPKDTRTRAS